MNNLMIEFLLFYLATKFNCYSHFSLVNVNFGHADIYLQHGIDYYNQLYQRKPILVH